MSWPTKENQHQRMPIAGFLAMRDGLGSRLIEAAWAPFSPGMGMPISKVGDGPAALLVFQSNLFVLPFSIGLKAMSVVL